MEKTFYECPVVDFLSGSVLSRSSLARSVPAWSVLAWSFFLGVSVLGVSCLECQCCHKIYILTARRSLITYVQVDHKSG